METRIMYIEYKGEGLTGIANIGRVTFTKTKRGLHYNGKTFQKMRIPGFKTNYYEAETGDEYWISGCKKDGSDRLYGERLPIYIDEEVRIEYWTKIRNQPGLADTKVINGKK